MALPNLGFIRTRRQDAQQQRADERQTTTGAAAGIENISEGKLTPTTSVAGVDIKSTTRARQNAVIISSVFFSISVIFLILTEIGNIKDKKVLRSSYFFKLNLADILPSTSASDAILVNSIARSLGLHDFYQVGLWNFCEGYSDEGITHCSRPQNLWWFNPVAILLSELFAGATIALPAKINEILTLIRIASRLMFGFFIVSLCMNFVFIFLAPIVLYSRWYSYHFVTFAFISALLSTTASIIATAMFSIFKRVITSQAGLNIGASLGAQMFAFMWIGTAFSVAGWVVHFYLACVSRKDAKAEKKKDNKAAHKDSVVDEKKIGGRRVAFPRFGRKKFSGEVV